MKIGLYYTNMSAGPGKVIWSTGRGIQLLGHEILHNALGDMNGALHGWVHYLENLPEKTLMGPCMVGRPPEKPWLWIKHKHHILASYQQLWYFSLFKEVLESGCTLHCCPTGIDTDAFNDKDKQIQFDFFTYQKNRQWDEVNVLREMLTSRGLKEAPPIAYGSYAEEELINRCKTCKFCLMVDMPETQGIAHMEILSCGTPMLVSDVQRLSPDFGDESRNVLTTLPYFDDRCGEKAPHNDLFLPHLDKFLHRLHTYRPREYILDNHTLKRAAQRYLEFLEISHS